jgi:protein phosphatase
MLRVGPLAVRYRADGFERSHAGMGTTRTAMLFSGGRAALAHADDSRAFRLRRGQLRPSTEDHTTGNLAWDAGLLAPVLARHLDGRPDRPADVGLRDLQADHRYLLRPDEPSPVAEDRPHRNVLTLRAASAGAPASWPS